MNNFENLIKKVQLITESGLPLMEGKEKISVDNVIGQVLTVSDYGFLNGEEGEYVVISIKEYPTNFIYGSSVVTQAFKNLDEQLTDEELVKILDEGLTFKLTTLVSKNKRKYTKITFFPKN